MIEELKGEVEFAGQLARVATAWAKYHGANNHIDPVYIFLAKHGPKLIAAVELAEAAIRHIDYDLCADGSSDTEWASLAADVDAMADAYRAAKEASNG